MAVFQGTRIRAVAFPTRSRRRSEPARGAVGAPARSAPRLRPTGLLMAAILTATMLGLVYLTQTLASNAASLAVTDLERTAEEKRRAIANLSSLIQIRSDAEDLVERARRQGLVLLDDPIILEAP